MGQLYPAVFHVHVSRSAKSAKKAAQRAGAVAAVAAKAKENPGRAAMCQMYGSAECKEMQMREGIEKEISASDGTFPVQ